MSANEEALARIIAGFNGGMSDSRKIQSIASRIASGKATYRDAYDFARESSRIMTGSMRKHIPEVLTDGKLYRETAETVVGTPMKVSGTKVSETAAEIQSVLNEQAGIGINGIEVDLNEDQITGIITGIANAESYDQGSGTLFDQIENFLEGVVDDSVRENEEFQYRAGLEPKVIRTAAGKCCKWCSNLAGTYKYEDVRDKGNDVWRRHRNCHCTIEYDPGQKSKAGRSDRRSTDQRRSDRIRASEEINPEESRSGGRKSLESEMKAQAGQKRNTLSEYIRQNHKVLAEYTPDSMLEALKKSGLQVEPLSGGKLRGIPYESGGGYKANFGGDGVLIYHPEKGSHHGGEYWKLSGGGKGAVRYDMDGNERP